MIFASRWADRISAAVWGVQTRLSLARWLRRMGKRVAATEKDIAWLRSREDGLTRDAHRQRDSLAALAEAVADLTGEMAGHRTRVDAELTLLRDRLDTYGREAGERERLRGSQITALRNEFLLTSRRPKYVWSPGGKQEETP